MKLVDANVLLYAVNEDAPHHAAARDWLDEALNGQEGVGFAWVVLLAFLRLGTRGGLFDRPLTLAEAVRITELWLAQPPAVPIHPTEAVVAAALPGLGHVTLRSDCAHDRERGTACR